MDGLREYNDRLWGVEAEVAVLAMLSFEDTLPVVTELNKRLGKVRASREESTPPMAADPDLAVQLILAGLGVAAVKKTIELLVEDAYTAIRNGLIALLRRAQERDDSRPWNLGVRVGSHAFYFSLGGPRDDAEFVRALRAIRRVLEESPPGLVDGSTPVQPEPGGAGWYWDAETGLWQPTPGIEEAMRRGRR